MKFHARVLALVALPAAFILVGFIVSAQRSPVPATNYSDPDLTLFLDNARVGSIRDKKTLSAQLAAIYLKKERSYVQPTDAPDDAYVTVKNRVILIPPNGMSIHQFGELAQAVKDSFEYETFSRKLALSTGQDCEVNAKRDPANMVLSTVLLAPEKLKAAADKRCYIGIDIRNTSSSRQLKSFRVAMTSLEMDADGTILLNDQTKHPKPMMSVNANWSVASNRALDAVPVKQRALSSGTLDADVADWIERRIDESKADREGLGEMSEDDFRAEPVELPIIVSAKLPVSALMPILRMIPRNKAVVTIVVKIP